MSCCWKEGVSEKRKHSFDAKYEKEKQKATTSLPLQHPLSRGRAPFEKWTMFPWRETTSQCDGAKSGASVSRRDTAQRPFLQSQFTAGFN